VVARWVGDTLRNTVNNLLRPSNKSLFLPLAASTSLPAFATLVTKLGGTVASGK
jgi:hypothetical protein